MRQKKWIVFIGALLFSFLFTQTVFANEKPLDASVADSVKINDTMNVIQDDAIFKMNEYREKLGLALFNKNVLVQKASQSHANYLFINLKKWDILKMKINLVLLVDLHGIGQRILVMILVRIRKGLCLVRQQVSRESIRYLMHHITVSQL